jgi:hypothetical protein
MPTTSESGMNAKLRYAKDFLTILRTFQTYAPLRQEESEPELTELVTQTEKCLNEYDTNDAAYTLAVKQRREKYTTAPDSLIKRLTLVSKTVQALYGKKSLETAQILNLIRDIRSQSKPKSEATTDISTEKTRSVSTSQRSYGSMLQSFKTLITTLNGLSAYSRVANGNSVADLQILHQQLDTLNTQLTHSMQARESARHTRTELFAQVKERFMRVKLAIAAQYGLGSMEYKSIKAYKF